MGHCFPCPRSNNYHKMEELFKKASESQPIDTTLKIEPIRSSIQVNNQKSNKKSSVFMWKSKEELII